jgi:hypothetical protein
MDVFAAQALFDCTEAASFSNTLVIFTHHEDFI